MIRLNRFIAEASGLSRRAADTAIAEGRVTIDGIVAEPTTKLETGQVVALDGNTIEQPSEHSYILFNKPVGYICSRVQQGTSPTIYELLPPEYQNLKSVGRLDLESSGLLLLSDDGEFIHRHLHPSFGKEKTYEVTLSKPLRVEDRNHIARGVKLDDGMSYMKPKIVHGADVTVVLEEGRNRQIRRTFAALGYQVIKLHRTEFGAFTLGTVEQGSFRALTAKETAA